MKNTHITRRESLGGMISLLFAPFAVPVVATGQLSEVALGWSTYPEDPLPSLSAQGIQQLGDYMSRSISQQSAAMSGGSLNF